MKRLIATIVLGLLIGFLLTGCLEQQGNITIYTSQPFQTTNNALQELVNTEGNKNYSSTRLYKYIDDDNTVYIGTTYQGVSIAVVPTKSTK